MHHKSRLIGVTGSVASGKSSVLAYLGELGYAVFSADTVIKEIYSNNEIQQKVLEILPEIKTFDKAKIASVIYLNQSKRVKLENFIHPLVKEKLEIFRHDLGNRMGFAEIPLLFEKEWEREFDYVIVVSCNDNIRKERAISRGMAAETFDRICKIQMTDKEKQKRGHFIIKTDMDIFQWKKNLDNTIEQLKI